MIVAAIVGVVVLSILLMQMVRVRREKKRVRRVRQYEAALKEFKELCGFSFHQYDGEELLRAIRRVRNDLARKQNQALLKNEVKAYEKAHNARKRIYELAESFGVHIKRPPERTAA